MAARLLAALEDLIGREGMYLRAGQYDLVVSNRRRTEPLVRQLAAMADLPGVRELRPLLDATLERSERNAALLREKMQELGYELRRTNQARYRTAQVAPAYSQTAGASTPRFAAAG